MSDVTITDDRSSSMSELDELRRRVDRIENGRDVRGQGPQIPFRDPTENVLDALAKDENHRKEIRDIDNRYREEIRRIQERCADEVAKLNDKLEIKEKDRLDAINQANTSNVALALGKTETQAVAQDRRIAVLEQNQYRGGGREEQRTEGRQSNQFAIATAIGLASVVIAVGAFFGLSQKPTTPITVTVVAPTPAPTR